MIVPSPDVRGGPWWTAVVLALALVFEAGRWCLHQLGAHRYCHHIQWPSACPTCHGTGGTGNPVKLCPTCNGPNRHEFPAHRVIP